jgi:hypothetical protein
MENQEKKLAIWKEAIPKMNEEDLEFILDFPECFETKVLKMVKARYDKLTKPDDDREEYEGLAKTLEDDLIDILEEMGCECELDEDGSINFSLSLDSYSEEVRAIIEGVEFSIMFGKKCRNIIVNEGCWKQINLDNDDEMGRLLWSINRANSGLCVNSFININNETRMAEVYCSVSYPYLPDKEYLKEQLDVKICEIIFANKLINQFKEEATIEDARQMFEEATLRQQEEN